MNMNENGGGLFNGLSTIVSRQTKNLFQTFEIFGASSSCIETRYHETCNYIKEYEIQV